jgi:hypothetical protein
MGASESFLEHQDKMRTYEFLRSGSSEAEPFVKGSDIYLYQNPIFFQKRQQSERVLHQKSVIP